MSDEELRALTERLYGYGSDDGVAASSAILALLEEKQRYALWVEDLQNECDALDDRATLAETRLARAVEGLREAKGAIDVAEIVGARNAAGYLTDRALWAQCAIDKINHILSEVTDDAG